MYINYILHSFNQRELNLTPNSENRNFNNSLKLDILIFTNDTSLRQLLSIFLFFFNCSYYNVNKLKI